jgi:hypothetical protein
MELVVYLILILGLIAVLYGWTVRRAGFMRFAKAVGALIANITAAVVKLVSGGAGKHSASRSGPLDLTGTGGRYNAHTGNYDNGQDPYGIYPDDDRRL